MADDIRKDLEEGLRFLHSMVMQTKQQVRDDGVRLAALTYELVEKGTVTLEGLNSQAQQLAPVHKAKDEKLYHVRIGDPADKYATTDLPEIDCKSLLHLCKARCCTLSVAINFQDLDEGVLRWDYATPYLLRRRPDGYCAHLDDTRGCTVYAQRPYTCRKYDCREDDRIWKDFGNKIPAEPPVG